MVTKDQLKSTDPNDVLDWEVSKVEAALKALDIVTGKNWSKPKKALELNQAIKKMNAEKKAGSAITAQDSNKMILQMFQKMKEQSQNMQAQLTEQLEHESDKSESQAEAMQASNQGMSAQSQWKLSHVKWKLLQTRLAQLQKPTIMAGEAKVVRKVDTLNRLKGIPTMRHFCSGKNRGIYM